MLSYAHRVGEEPLLGETIAANLERTIVRSSSTRRPGTRWASGLLVAEAVDRYGDSRSMIQPLAARR
jgi:hypothetical protein